MEASLNYCVQVMINESMAHILDAKMAKLLSLVSRFISNTVKRFIEDNFYFFLPIIEIERKFQFYQPKCIYNVTSISQISASTRKVKFNDIFNIYADLSMFANLTHISYGWGFNQSIENRKML
eukprot:TRINITY_DN3335_c0_g1_i4.p1 TRINITY_DN3335_c0_g1~~TRINITY_DN3335_c0_g1_i4.p1  ORF type:complete len:123 (+),score=21.56 TRINITY_DN3335_c0_g1_i4:269-637(+)